MIWNPIEAAKDAAVAHVNRQVAGYVDDLEEKLRERGMLGQNESIRSQTGELDAIRHAYTLGRLSQDYGYQTAKFMGDQHEARNPNPPDHQRMDYHNNDMGARYGIQVINEAHRNRLQPGETIEDRLFERVLQGARNGELITDPSQTRPRVGQLRSDAGDSGVQVASADIGQNPRVQETVAAVRNTPGMDPDRIGNNGVAALALASVENGFKPNFAGQNPDGSGFVVKGAQLDSPTATVVGVSADRMQLPAELSVGRIGGLESQQAVLNQRQDTPGQTTVAQANTPNQANPVLETESRGIARA